MIIIITFIICAIVVIASVFLEEIAGGVVISVCVAIFGFGFLSNVIPVKTELYPIEDYTITKTPIRVIVESNTNSMYEIFDNTDFFLNTNNFDIFLQVNYNSYGRPIYKYITYKRK